MNLGPCLMNNTPLLSRDINISPLYRHIKAKEDDSSMEELFLSDLIKEVKNDKELAFLRNNPEFLKLLSKYDL